MIGLGVGRTDAQTLSILPIFDTSAKFHISQAHAISGDGAFVVGESATRAPMYQTLGVRWANSGTRTLNLSSAFDWASVNAANFDGRVLIGETGEKRYINGALAGLQNVRSAVWTVNDGLVSIRRVSTGTTSFTGTSVGAVDYAGLVIGGSVSTANQFGSTAALWQSTHGQFSTPTVLPRLNQGSLKADGQVVDSNWTDSVTALSAGGNVAVGVSGDEAFRWTAAGGVQPLGYLPAGQYPGSLAGTYSAATAVSADGSVAVGRSDLYDFAGPGTSATEAVRWVTTGATTTVQSLGFLTPLIDSLVDPNTGDIVDVATHSTVATAVSADGNTVVGDSRKISSPLVRTNVPFIWTPAGQMQDLMTVARGVGIDTGGYLMYGATGISADGRTILVDGDYSTPQATVGVLYIGGPSAVLKLPGPGTGGWYNDADGTWGTVPNWTLGDVPQTAGNTAVFGNVITAPRTVTLTGATTTGSLRFDSPVTRTPLVLFDVTSTYQGSYTLAGAGTLTLSSGQAGVRSAIDVTRGSHFINTPVVLANGLVARSASGASLRINGNLSGTGGLTVAGTGTGQIVLAGTSTYTGATRVDSGVLRLAARSAFYNATPASWTAASLVVRSGGVAAFNVGGAGEFTSGDLASIIALGTASGGFLSGSAVGFDTSSANFTYNNAIANPNAGANSLGVYKLGANTLTLGGASSFTGGTTLVAGSISLNNASALGATTSPLTLLGGSLLLNGNSPTVGDLTGVSGTTVRNSGTTVRNSGTTPGTATLTVNQAGRTTFSGSLTNSVTAGVLLALTKIGSGTLTLSGTNNYSGATTINAGTLAFGRRASLYNATPASWTATSLVVQPGATAAFAVGGSGEFASTDLDTLLALGTAGGGFRSGSTAGIVVASSSFTYAGSISNPNAGTNTRGLTKLGAGRLLLTGTNSYTGPTTVDAGILQFNNRSSLYNATPASWTATNLTVGSGATLALKVGGADEFTLADVQAVAAITGPGTGFRAGSSLGIDTGSVSTFTFTGGLADVGSASRGLVKLGAGTLTLPASTYTGPTAVLGGSLLSTSPLQTPASELTVTGANSSAILSATAVPNAYTVAGEFASITLGTTGQNGVSRLVLSQTNRNANRASVLVTGTLEIPRNTTPAERSGFLDLGNNDLIVRNGDVHTLRNMVLNWYGNIIGDYGSGTGKGWYGATGLGFQNTYFPGVFAGIGSSASSITDSGPVFASAPYTTLAVFPNDDGNGNPHFTTYNGVTGLTASAVIVKYTYIGDTNLDGTLDGIDLANFLEGFSTGTTGWQSGDLNYSGGAPDNTDALLFFTAFDWFRAQANPTLFGNGLGTDPDPAGVIPEPAGVAMLLVPPTLLASRRHSRRRRV